MIRSRRRGDRRGSRGSRGVIGAKPLRSFRFGVPHPFIQNLIHREGPLRRITFLRPLAQTPEELIALFGAIADGLLPNIRRLDLGNGLLNGQMAPLVEVASGGGFPRLESLDLTMDDLTSDDVLLLSNAIASGAFPLLNSLILANNEIGPDAMMYFSLAPSHGGGFDGLRDLNLADNSLGTAGFRFLCLALGEGYFPALRGLVVSNNILDGECISLLTAIDLPNLIELWLDGNAIGGQGLEALAEACTYEGNLRGLEDLYLWECDLDSETWQGISTLEGGFNSLRQLYIYGNYLQSEGLKYIAACADRGGFTDLEKLDTYDNGIEGAEGIAAFAAASARGGFPSLLDLVVNNNPLGPEGVTTLADGVRRGAFGRLLDLELDDVGMDNASLLSLVEAPFQSLWNLSICDNDGITKEGVMAVAEALKRGALPAIRYIQIYGEEIDYIGLAIARRGLLGLNVPPRVGKAEGTAYERFYGETGDYGVMGKIRDFL